MAIPTIHSQQDLSSLRIADRSRGSGKTGKRLSWFTAVLIGVVLAVWSFMASGLQRLVVKMAAAQRVLPVVSHQQELEAVLRRTHLNPHDAGSFPRRAG